MYLFKVNGKEYKVRFTYKSICKGDVLDRFTAVVEGDSIKNMLNHVVTVTAETLIAGLQKYHSDEFGYDNEEQRLALIDRVFDLFDDYEDESTPEHPQSAATLFTDLKDELEKNGFLSMMTTQAEEMTEAMETAEAVKTEIENTPARVVVDNTTATTSKS